MVSDMKDPAMLVYGRDFYEDEAVKLMTCEQEGAYWRLLIHAHQEGSIPANIDHLCVIVGKIPAKRFPQVWAAISCKWHPKPDAPDRLINHRQERERAKRQESKRRMSEGGRKGNATRWEGESPPDRNPIAPASPPDRIPSHPIPIHLHPADPDTERTSSFSASPPQKDDRSLASGPAGSSGKAGPAELFEALRKSSYRGNSKHRDNDLLTASQRLSDAGITPSDLIVLAHRAARKGKKPAGLFATWIDDAPEALKELGKR